jgi:hypothetical protein
MQPGRSEPPAGCAATRLYRSLRLARQAAGVSWPTAYLSASKRNTRLCASLMPVTITLLLGRHVSCWSG